MRPEATKAAKRWRTISGEAPVHVLSLGVVGVAAERADRAELRGLSDRLLLQSALDIQ